MLVSFALHSCLIITYEMFSYYVFVSLAHSFIYFDHCFGSCTLLFLYLFSYLCVHAVFYEMTMCTLQKTVIIIVINFIIDINGIDLFLVTETWFSAHSEKAKTVELV